MQRGENVEWNQRGKKTSCSTYSQPAPALLNTLNETNYYDMIVIKRTPSELDHKFF